MTTTPAGALPVDALAIHRHMMAAGLALAAAAQEGLPAPFAVHVSENEVKLGFTTHTDLVDWATWCDEPIGTHNDGYGLLQHNVVCELMTARFNLWALEVIDDEAVA